MKYFFPLFISGLLLSSSLAHAGECDDPQGFNCYTKRVTEQCTTVKPNSWDGKDKIYANSIRGTYAEYSVAALLKNKEALAAQASNLPSDTAQKAQLDRSTNDPFASVKQARLQYQRNMNNIFACAVIGSRLKNITALQGIMKQTSGKNTGMETKLSQEMKKLENLKANLKC